MASQQIFSNETAKAVIADLFQAGKKVYLACTGAGAGVTNLLWQVPGASTTLVGSSFPYAQGEFNLFVGKNWKESGHSYCGPEAAIALAQAAYLRCQQVCVESGEVAFPVIGVGLTAAAATNRTLRGGTRCFAAVRTEDGIHTVEVWMEQGFLGRDGDGTVCDLVALNLVLFAVGLPQVPLAADLHLTSEQFSGVEGGLVLAPAPLPAPPVPSDLSEAVLVTDDKVEPIGGCWDFSRVVVFPGSFNPLQFGHDAIARTVEQATGKAVFFEITAGNVDKAALTGEELARRAQQFTGRWPVILRSDAGRFAEKAEAYPGASFVVGADTAIRMLNSKYYADEKELATVLRRFAELGTKFYVLCRSGEGGVLSCENLPVPQEFKELFVPLPGRWDISSTTLRQARNK